MDTFPDFKIINIIGLMQKKKISEHFPISEKGKVSMDSFPDFRIIRNGETIESIQAKVVFLIGTKEFAVFFRSGGGVWQ